MRKNGFVATTLIYSFFLIFCTILLAFIGLNIHNENLLDRVNNDIRNEINQNLLLSDVFLNSYFKLNITHSNLELSNVNWILTEVNEEEATFISDIAVADSSNAGMILEISNSCMIGTAEKILVAGTDDEKYKAEIKFLSGVYVSAGKGTIINPYQIAVCMS